MSRSRKKSPYVGYCSNDGQKKFRSQENRAKRHRVKQVLLMGDENLLPNEKEYGNEWASPRDGKHRLDKDLKQEDPKLYRRFMNK